MFINYNPNPLGKNVDDCAIRAVSKVLDISWDSAYDKLVVFGKSLGDLPNSNEVIDALLQFNGFKRYSIPNTCPFCYQARDFCQDNPEGCFVLGFGAHMCAVIDGDIYDSQDTSLRIPIYYYRKE